jgi:dihydrofolate reductase
MFNIILATDDKNGLGKDNSIPWNIPKDVELFKSLTSSICGINKVVIMGYKTMMSLKNGYLKNRINIIITSKIIQSNLENENIHYVSNFNEALSCAYSLVGKDASRVWVIGGAIVYASAINHPDLNFLLSLLLSFFTFALSVITIVPISLDSFNSYGEKTLENIWSFDEVIGLETLYCNKPRSLKIVL